MTIVVTMTYDTIEQALIALDALRGAAQLALGASAVTLTQDGEVDTYWRPGKVAPAEVELTPAPDEIGEMISVAQPGAAPVPATPDQPKPSLRDAVRDLFRHYVDTHGGRPAGVAILKRFGATRVSEVKDLPGFAKALRS